MSHLHVRVVVLLHVLRSVHNTILIGKPWTLMRQSVVTQLLQLQSTGVQHEETGHGKVWIWRTAMTHLNLSQAASGRLCPLMTDACLALSVAQSAGPMVLGLRDQQHACVRKALRNTRLTKACIRIAF